MEGMLIFAPCCIPGSVKAYLKSALASPKGAECGSRAGETRVFNKIMRFACTGAPFFIPAPHTPGTTGIVFSLLSEPYLTARPAAPPLAPKVPTKPVFGIRIAISFKNTTLARTVGH
jgi:hypothetical protein